MGRAILLLFRSRRKQAVLDLRRLDAREPSEVPWDFCHSSRIVARRDMWTSRSIDGQAIFRAGAVRATLNNAELRTITLVAVVDVGRRDDGPASGCEAPVGDGKAVQ